MSEGYKALYRKYRPMTFDDVHGQEHIVPILKNQIATGKAAHAYLFCGTRGTGKTTCAKIFARAVNCESPRDGSPCGECPSCIASSSGLNTDIVEMDAASNTGVNDVRDLIDEITYTPTELKYRVYIIDEVHMMSTQAFNALLKTLEEPPSHVIFILATTEIHKLPATIVSRCQRFDFGKIDTSVICKRLGQVAEKENIDIDEDALFVMAKLAGGGLRDALGYLELCAGQSGKIDGKRASELLGVTPYDALLSVVSAVSEKDIGSVFAQIEDACRKTNDISVFVEGLTSVYRDMLVVKTVPNYRKYVDLTPSQAELLEKTAQKLSKEKILYHIKTLNDALFLMAKNTSVKRMAAELALVRMCDERLDTSNDAILSRISSLEDKITLGVYSAPVQSEVKAEPVKKTEEAPKVPVKEEKTEIKEEKPIPADPAGDKKSLKVYRKWGEVTSKITASDISSMMYLSGSNAYEGDGILFIFFPGELAKTIAETNRGKIVNVITIISDGKYNERNISFGCKENINEEYTLLDDFVKDNIEGE